MIVRTKQAEALIDPGDESLQLYVVNVEPSPPRPWVAYIAYTAKRLVKNALKHEPRADGVYLDDGWIITAAHVVDPDSTPLVRIAGLELPATVVKRGEFDQIDLALLQIDQESLPLKLQMRQRPICRGSRAIGTEVTSVTPKKGSHSSIMSPDQLPPDVRRRVSTVIRDVASTGNSGSGLFDEASKCLLGIVSRKIFVRPRDSNGPERDIAKYFVPAPEISTFVHNVRH